VLRINLKKEYLLIAGITLFTLIITLFSGFFRILFGLPYVLFVPGYLLTTVFFPKTDNPDSLTRIALSVGLSIIIVPLIGLLHNYLSWTVGLLPLMISLTFLNSVLMVLGWFRRKKLPEKERFALTLGYDLKEWAKKSKETKIIFLALLIMSLILIVTLIYILFIPKSIKSFTEFYITGQDGTAADYPEELQAGEYGNVIVNIINNENRKTIYRLEIKVDGNIIQSINQIALDYPGKWENMISFKAEKPNDAAKVEFILFKESQNIPYRQLKLWVKVD
jgi:uncharacterized membrane protein